MYLDVERVKSVIAQMDQGLADNFTEIVESQKGGEVGGKAGFFGLGAVEASGNYLTTDNRTVSSTFHDFAYTYMESQLLKDDQVSIVRVNSPWQFQPGQFFLMQGQMALDDFEYMTSMAKDFPNLQTQFTKLGLLEEWKSHTSKQKKDFHRRVAEEVENSGEPGWYFETISSLIRTFYGDQLYVTGRVGHGASRQKVQGPLLPAWLRDSPEIIRFKYGSKLTGNWCLFGQVAALPVDESRLPPNGSNSEFLDDAVDVVLDHLRSLRSALEGSLPKVTVTPIAIYRESYAGPAPE